MTNLLLIWTSVTVFLASHETIRFILQFLVALSLITLYVLCIRALIKLGLTKARESQKSLELLRRALAETQQMAQTRLINADSQLYGKVTGLLIEAGKHLQPPIADSRIFFDIYLISWHYQGYNLVAQANQMIADYHHARQWQLQQSQ